MTQNTVKNPKFELFKTEVLGKNVGVLGVGVSNLPLIEFLNGLGAYVTAFDRRTADKFDEGTLEILKKNTKGMVLGEDYLDRLDGMEIIIKTPGIHPNTPQLVRAAENNVIVTSEMEIFVSICPCKTIGVTGSDGKTTTTTLIYEMLKTEGYNCHVGGNIGRPLLADVELISPSDIVILELSSFQLQSMVHSPDIAVVTNVAPNHLDYHKDMEEYTNAKKNIFTHQNVNGKLIVNMENEITDAFENEASGEVIKFSLRERPKHGAYLYRSKIYFDDEPILRKADIKIPGEHNVDNYLAAICAVHGLVKKETVSKVARTFGGVPHRLELIREFNGVKFYNDSIASSPTRTSAGLRAFKNKVVLIAGGYDKKIPFDGFGEIVVKKTKAVVLVGATAEKLREEIEKTLAKHEINEPVITCTMLTEAVKSAYSLADEGDAVLLSPACASFDMFKNFEERGNAFKEIVANLGKAEL